MATPDDLGFVADDDLGFEPDAPAALQRLKEVASPAKDKALPMSPLAATLKAMGELPNQRLGGLTPWLMEKVSLTAQPVKRAGAPEVGGGETYLNKAVNILPAGGVATDLGTAGSFLLAQKAGKVAPDISRALSGLTGRLLPESLQIGPVPGPGAVLTPQALKELAVLGEDAKEPDTGAVDTYRRLRDVRRTRTEAGEEQNPLAALAGSGTGLGLSLLAPLPKFSPAGGAAATTGAKIAAGAKTGGAYGGLAGLTSGDADTAGGDFTNTALQGAFGLGLGSLLGGAAPAAGAFGSRLIRGVVKPTPAAQALQKEGVEGLTLGQMDPKSTIGVLESANQSVPGFGPALAGAREAAKDSFRVAALNKALPPGMEKLPQNTPVAEGLGKIQEGFSKAYQAVDDIRVPTASADNLLVRLADPKLRIASRATQSAADDAAAFVQDQMTLLPADGTQTTAGMLRTMRSALRDEIRERLTSNNKHDASVARMLKAAEEELTSGLEKALPEDAAKLLRAADAQYGKYKVLEDAAFKAKDTVSGKGEFTPERLGLSVRDAAKAGGKADYVAGGGGPFRDLEASAIQSFQEIPPTGLRALLAGGLAGRYLAAPALYFANRPGVQPFMLGQTKGQQGAQKVQEALQRYLSRLNTSPQTLAPQAIFEARRTAPQDNP